jgi:uncharacterized membrane protein YfcA
VNLEGTDWLVAVAAALIVGVAKAGIGGLGLLAAVLFTQILPAKAASGALLPLLCLGDLVGAALYRRHADWGHLGRLFPWTALGVLAGYFLLERLSDLEARRLVGGIVLGMVALHLIRRRREPGKDAFGAWFAPGVGVLAGITTLVANAAGPLMAIYFLAMRLPKLDFVGTAAVFFLVLNLFKVPFMGGLGLITPESLRLNLLLAPAVLAGAWGGRAVVARIDQRAFENVALALSVLAAVRLLF